MRPPNTVKSCRSVNFSQSTLENIARQEQESEQYEGHLGPDVAKYKSNVNVRRPPQDSIDRQISSESSRDSENR